MMARTDPHLILDAGRGLWRFGLVVLVATGLSGVMGLMVADLVLGLNPNVGDRGHSVSEKLGFALFALAISGSALSGTALMGARYLLSIRVSGTDLEIVTLSLTGRKRRVIDPARMTPGARFQPVMQARQRVDAPWQSLRIAGYRVPFVIDLQARFYDEQRLQRIIARAQGQMRG